MVIKEQLDYATKQEKLDGHKAPTKWRESDLIRP